MVNPDARLNVLIVDDEIEACINLKSILLEFVDPDINIMSVAHSTAEAETKLQVYNPDAIFLDIEMPNENAFQFLERIAPIQFEVVFVTAYDEYAIKAFKLNAVDYILKPISITELKNAVGKLKERLKYKSMLTAGGSDFTEVSKQINTKAKLNKITLKDNNNVEIVAFKDVVYIEAFGGYSKVFFLKDGRTADMLTSNSISEYEDMLPNTMFFRIHKSYLVNCSHIKKIHKDDSLNITMHPAYTVPVSRRRFAGLVEFLQTKPDFDE